MARVVSEIRQHVDSRVPGESSSPIAPTPLPLSELPNYGRLEADPELYSRVAGKPSTQLDFDELCALRPAVAAAIVAEAPRTVFVKTHSMAGVHDGTPLITPQGTAGAIYVVRNPLDVVISMSHHFAHRSWMRPSIISATNARRRKTRICSSPNFSDRGRIM